MIGILMLIRTIYRNTFRRSDLKNKEKSCEWFSLFLKSRLNFEDFEKKR